MYKHRAFGFSWEDRQLLKAIGGDPDHYEQSEAVMQQLHDIEASATDEWDREDITALINTTTGECQGTTTLDLSHFEWSFWGLEMVPDLPPLNMDDFKVLPPDQLPFY